MYGGVTWYVESKETCGLRVGGREQSADKIFRAKKAKVAEAWRKFCDLHGLRISTDIIGMVE
jgi:hypothetical protein